MAGMDAILNEFGGVRPLARALGRKDNASTVQYWKSQARLPYSASADVLSALMRQGVSERRARKLVLQAVIGCGETLATAQES